MFINISVVPANVVRRPAVTMAYSETVRVVSCEVLSPIKSSLIDMFAFYWPSDRWVNMYSIN